MNKIIEQGEKCRVALARGVDALANPVKATLGPKGRLVIIGQRAFNMSPRVTKDGVTVANHVNCKDPIEQMACDLIREAAQKTVQKAGDGTTTSTLLAQALVHAGMQQLAAKISPDELARGANKALALVLNALDEMAVPAEGDMLEQVAKISANGDMSIAKLVVEAVKAVGKEGVIACEPSQSLDTTLELIDGMQLPEGMRSHYFINQLERVECVLENPTILMHEGRIETAQQLLYVAQIARKLDRPLLVIAGDFGPEALSFLVTNKVKNGFACCAIRAAGYGERRREILKDIAALAGGQPVTDDLGLKLENLTADYLGQAKRMSATEDRTIITGGAGDKKIIEARAEEIRQRIATMTEEHADPTQIRLVEQRLSGLTGGVAVLKVGGATEAEMSERKDRVEDAMYATKAAVESGVVPGGGLALLRAAAFVQTFTESKNCFAGVERPRKIHPGYIFPAKPQPSQVTPGAKMIYDICAMPMQTIADNAGKPGLAVVEKVRDYFGVAQAIGYNAATDNYEDLVKAGILDPLKVVKEALTNAVSAAMNIIRTEAVIAEDFSEVKQ